MSEIKSAYEKAMERFEDVKPDKNALHRKEIKDKGRMLCAKALQQGDMDIEKELAPSDDKELLRDGFGEALLAQINLPNNQSAVEKIDIIERLAIKLSPRPAVVQQLIKQYKQLCQQYIEEKVKMSEHMQVQYEQIMQQTQQTQQASKQQNTSMHPKFVQAMQEQLKALDEQFAPAIHKVRTNLRQLCGFALEK